MTFTIRTPSPLRNELCTIVVQGKHRWIAMGDVFSIVKAMPMLPAMAATKRKVFGHRQFIAVSALEGWAELLINSGYKEPGRELQTFAAWATTIKPTELLPERSNA